MKKVCQAKTGAGIRHEVDMILPPCICLFLNPADMSFAKKSRSAFDLHNMRRFYGE
jgi:hypothetical protein